MPIATSLQDQRSPIHLLLTPQNQRFDSLSRGVRWLGLWFLVLPGCKGAEGLLLPSEGEPASIEVVRGNAQSGKVNERLASPVVVEVTDTRDRPVEGATVTFELTSGGPGADIVPRTAITDANGQASAQILLGTTIGRHTGEASVAVDEGTITPKASFTAEAVPVDANTMAAVGGVDLIGRVDAPLQERLVVQVTDAFGNPISGRPISWEAQGGGTVSETLVNTDDLGRASVERVLGPVAGQQTTVATSPGLAGSPVTFVHTALAGDASLLTIVSGDNQTGQVGTPLPADLVVRLIDAEGNGVPNTAVTWVVATGGGSVTPTNSDTDQDGRASARWTLGGTPGAGRLDAVVSGVGVASFEATATAGAPAALAIVTQPSSSARNGFRFERQPVIQLRDAAGNPVAQAGVLVSAALGAGSGDLTGTRQRVTDANGRASFTDLAISGAAGRYTLVFSSPGYASATSSAIDLQSISTSTTIVSDAPDPSAPGAPFTVEFRVTSGGPTPTGSVTISDGSGSCSGELRGGTGSCSLAIASSGQRTLTATYSGGPGLERSSDTETHRVEAAAPPPPGATVTTITGDSPDPSLSGSTITVSFRVTASGTTPTGSVRVTVSGGNSTCTGTLSGGEGSCQLSLTAVGERTLTATYSGAPGLQGSSDTEPHIVTAQAPANQAPNADYNWTCTGLTCQFTDASRDNDGTLVGWRWDFGHDGANSTERNPSHTFPGTGSYMVTLTATDNSGASDVSSATVSVQAPQPTNSPPAAAFNPPGCTATQPCQFTDGSSDPDGTVVGWSWSFGEGGTSEARNPSYTYGVAGSYQVTLTARDDDGATGSVTHQVTVAAAPPPPNQEPGADYNWTCTGLTCQFTDASRDDDGTVVGWRWDFGHDGASSSERNPSHTFPGPGSYTVTLTATDEDGATDATSATIRVEAPNQAPTADFSFECDELECDFEDESSDPEGRRIRDYEWSFGDGGTSDRDDPDHEYDAPGTYQVTLTVTDDDGASSSITKSVTVSEESENQAPAAVIGSISCTGMNCTYTDASTDPDGEETIARWSWIFGDGQSSIERNPLHAYSTPGDYPVSLTVTDDGGLTDNDERTVTVQASSGGDEEVPEASPPT